MSSSAPSTSSPFVSTLYRDSHPIALSILTTISIVHLLNDIMQAVIPATFPILQQTMHLTYTELGLIGFANSMTASIMQPVIGWYTDTKPRPYWLPLGMVCTMVGMGLLSIVSSLAGLILAVMLVGLGSAIFHPEASRIVLLAAGEKRGLAQSVFQVGGNMGTSFAPLITLIIFVPLGQSGAIWFVGMAVIAIVMLIWVAHWYKIHLHSPNMHGRIGKVRRTHKQARIIRFATALIIFLAFLRAWFVAGISNFYALFQIQHFGVPLSIAQAHTFTFLFSGAVGTLFGGMLADRFGKKYALVFSTLGCAPFALFLPFLNAATSGIVSYFVIAGSGFTVLTGFTVALLYTLDLFPGRTGMVSGLMFGLAFGLGALGSLALGKLADWLSIDTMMILCCFLPFLGLTTYLLPDDTRIRAWNLPKRS
ncbi:MAG: MFS transporter [Bacteroidota bacterium]|nr:MFS transporter [Candidatus Kapabacteria bacterium]MDW8220462.1 MFS transporter [Bacteroidota bacterium]